MQSLTNRLDRLAGLDSGRAGAAWLDRIAFVFLTLMVLSAPHSIAATQIAWGIGMLASIVGFFFRPRTVHKFRPLSIALAAFFVWSAISAAFSYDPANSINSLRGVSVFLILTFSAANIRRLGAVFFLAFALIVSCMVNVVWTPVQRLIGRGVEIHGLNPNGPLTKALLADGDTLLAADGKKLNTPDDVVAGIQRQEVSKIRFYRPDFEFAVDVKRADLLAGATPLEKLGVESWSRSRNWRSSGFYSHYATYAEVLQLIGSLIFGLLIGAVVNYTRIRRWIVPLLLAALSGTGLALLLTVTRASQLAFLISSFAIVLRGAGRRIIIAAVIIAIPVMVGGLIFLQQSRHTGFFDKTDESTRYRFVMWNDGYRLLTSSARNLAFGIGMDSVKTHWREWGMYEGGALPIGHFHSAPIQIIVERGIPALIIWLIVIGIYGRILWRGIRRACDADWRAYGVLLGCFGALTGFITSGFVHWNLGDQEVAMVFYLLMAFGVRTTELLETEPQTAMRAAA